MSILSRHCIILCWPTHIRCCPENKGSFFRGAKHSTRLICSRAVAAAAAVVVVGGGSGGCGGSRLWLLCARSCRLCCAGDAAAAPSCISCKHCRLCRLPEDLLSPLLLLLPLLHGCNIGIHSWWRGAEHVWRQSTCGCKQEGVGCLCWAAGLRSPGLAHRPQRGHLEEAHV